MTFFYDANANGVYPTTIEDISSIYELAGTSPMQGFPTPGPVVHWANLRDAALKHFSPQQDPSEPHYDAFNKKGQASGIDH